MSTNYDPHTILMLPNDGGWYAVDQRVADYVHTTSDKNRALLSLLADWQEFATDVSAADCGGQDWLDGLRDRTKTALEQKA